MQTILVQMRAEASSLDYAECSRECALANPEARFAMNGQSYLCDRKNKPRLTPPRLQGKGNYPQGTSAKPPRRRDPTSTPHSSGQQVRRYIFQGCGKDSDRADDRAAGRQPTQERVRRLHALEARCGATPKHQNVVGRGSDGGGRRSRKSD